MDLNNTNYRKRRLLDENVTSSNSSLIKRDASTSTVNNKPMTLDMWSQTESKDEATHTQDLKLKIDYILQKLSHQESILEEIRDHIFQQSSSSSSNVEYKIVADEHGNGITIEQIQPNEIIEESAASPPRLIIPENSFQTPHSSHNTATFPDSNPRRYGDQDDKKAFKMKSELLNASTIQHVQNQLAKPLITSVSVTPAAPAANMIPIGPNKTLISSDVIDSIDWATPSSATRKLLTNIFSRETLATHSLTGRPSPAFHGREKPLKNKLNADKVQDIIHTVAKYSHVPEKEVRNAITTKCADENKMFNQRLRKALKDRNKENNNE